MEINYNPFQNIFDIYLKTYSKKINMNWNENEILILYIYREKKLAGPRMKIIKVGSLLLFFISVFFVIYCWYFMSTLPCFFSSIVDELHIVWFCSLLVILAERLGILDVEVDCILAMLLYSMLVHRTVTISHYFYHKKKFISLNVKLS